MVKFKIKKLNNEGSTFVLALLVITLLTTLAFALASASLTNMMMKSVDRTAKKNFYTAESLLDEVRAGIGYNSLDNMAAAYELVLSSLIMNEQDGVTVKDNNTANTDLKNAYIENVLAQVTGGKLSFGLSDEVATDSTTDEARTNAVQYIQSYIQGYAAGMANVTSVGTIKAYKGAGGGQVWAIAIEDVAFSYKEERNGEISFANITTDIEIEYPNMKVDFTTTNRITDFINYGLIADNSLQIAGKTVKVNASAYAGHLIEVVPDTSRGADVTFSSLTNENINVVCGGNSTDASDDGVSGSIKIGGNADYQSVANFSRANIWCNNILTHRYSINNDKGAKIFIDDKCNSYVRDDLTLEAANSEVALNGKYYGYMYDGFNVGHGASSAIIVNGTNSKLSVGASKLMIGGHAYIDIATDKQYMTGEALALKGSQEVYLVPDKFLGQGYKDKIQNPTSVDAWTAMTTAATTDTSIKVFNMDSTYFAKNYLVDGDPYEVITLNEMVYVYWNFKDNASAASFIKDVADGKDPELKDKLTKFNSLLFGSSSITVSTESANIESTGMFMQSNSGLPGYKAPSATANDVFTLTNKDLKNRYQIISHLLVSLPWESGNVRYYATNAEQALEQLRGISLENNELEQTAIIYNILSMDLLTGASANEYNRAGKPIVYGTELQNYTKVAVKGDYTVPDGSGGTTKIDGGIIVATGSVTLNHNFDGLIIAGGDIKIVGDAQITTNSNMIEEFILGKEDFKDGTTEDIAFKAYFLAYKSMAVEEDSAEDIKIENLNYKDLVSFDNWRKYED